MDMQTLKQLDQLYRELEGELPPRSQENLCGSCQECCTNRGATLHQVTELELAYLGQTVEPSSLQAFRDFADRSSDQEVCPFYQQGCTVYSHRPLSCRLFGHFRARSTALPEVCVFRGQEHIFESERYFDEVPLTRRFKELVRKYWLYHGGGEQLRPVAAQENAPSDDLDRALWLQSQGHLEEAAHLLNESPEPKTAYYLYCFALILEGLGQHQLAIQALEDALTKEPECATIWFRLGCNAFQFGDLKRAQNGFEQTLEREPEHAQAWGFLGCLLLQSGAAKQAMGPLSRAVALKPENPSFAKFFALASAAAEPPDS